MDDRTAKSIDKTLKSIASSLKDIAKNTAPPDEEEKENEGETQGYRQG
jgi:soluble cytochrome b562